MTLKLKIALLQLYEYQMKASNPDIVKIAMECSIDLLVTSNDP